MRARARMAVAGFLLILIPGGRAAVAQFETLHHPDDKFGADAEGAYVGSAYRQSEGGEPDLDFPSQDVELGSWLTIADMDPAATSANDCWGYTAPSGREYALIGLRTGTAVVEVTDPTNAQLIATIAGPTSSWRDIKTYDHYAYAATEGSGGGIQVIDLDAIDSGTASLVATVAIGGSNRAHNLAVNEDSGRLYAAGGASFGFRSFDLSNPALPVSEGQWGSRYCHDVQVVAWTLPPFAGVDVAFCFAGNTPSGGSPGIEILDVTDMASVSVIGSIDLTLPPIFSHAAQYSHQGWLSPDRQLVYLNDEMDEGILANPTLTRVIDVSDLTNPTQVATFTNGGTSRDHNLYTQGNLIYEANYRSGLRVFDATSPTAPTEVAFFDTYPPNDDAHFNGLWSVYPYFASGTIIGSDIEKGLFVWTLEDDCAVPDITGAVVSDCSEGGTTASGTTCTWATEDGYTCTHTGVRTCNDGSFDEAVSCTENSCAAYNFPAGAEPGVSDGCSDGIELQPVSDPSCSIACGVGFSLGEANVTCPADATPGQTTSGGTCLADCSVPVVTGASVTGCSEGGSTESGSDCTWASEDGYTCTHTGVRTCSDGSFDETVSCTENSCAAYGFPTGALPGASDPCSNGIELQPVSDPTCSIACEAGYTVTSANVSCPSDATPGQATSGGTCSENSCAAYAFPPGALPGASDPCSDGIVLQPVSDAGCTITCGPGFGIGDANVVCPFGAAPGQATSGGTCLADCSVPVVTGASVSGCTEGGTTASGSNCTWASEDGYTCTNTGIRTCSEGSFDQPVSCTENSCAAYAFPPGALPGASDPCSDGIVLQPVSDPGCTIACGAGFSVGDANVSCASDATPGQATGGGTCLADCAVPVVPGASVTGCSEGGSTPSGSSCTWADEPGFICSNTGSQLCTEGSFPATPSCGFASSALPALPPWGAGLAALGLLAVAVRLSARVRARKS